jgi:hypothetical protein
MPYSLASVAEQILKPDPSSAWRERYATILQMHDYEIVEMSHLSESDLAALRKLITAEPRCRSWSEWR